MSEENRKVVGYLDERIEELKIEIAKHESDENERNYSFYLKGMELYRELVIVKAQLRVKKRYLQIG